MTINTRQDLADFALRQLGAGVVNIEVTADQLDDAIDLAVEFYQEYHFDGIERDYGKHQITGTKLTFADVTGFAVGDTVSGVTTRVFSVILAIDVPSRTMLIKKQTPGPIVLGAPLPLLFQIGEQISNGTVQSALVSTVLGDVDLEYINFNDDAIVGVNRILSLSSIVSTSNYMYNPQYQLMMQEVQNLASGGFNYLYGAMQYLGELDFMLKKEKDFRFNRRWGKLYLDINWFNDVTIGDFILIDLYRALDPTLVPKMYNDRWLKEYTTAQVKKVWGLNLKKYSGMQLPGGLNYNGQIIYDEAIGDIDKLEAYAINSSAPLSFSVG